MSDDDVRPPISLDAERAKRDVSRTLAKRSEPQDAAVSAGWTVDGRVFMRLDNPEWEITWPLTIEQTRTLISDLQKYAYAAERRRDLVDGFVRLTWCSPTGKSVDDVIFGGVPAKVRGRVRGGVHLNFAPELERAQLRWTKEPPFGWPPAGLYLLKTGAHADAPARRRRWQIVPKDLEWLRENEVMP